MVTAIVLINVKHGDINVVADQLAGMQGIAEVYSVGGRFDLVAIIRVATNEEMAGLVTNSLVNIDGIEDTETLMAFRAYSSYDLERMFAVGADE
ncbi:MAG: Lrp/AsnC ligand binding domain-containing protein [Caldilineaceae bacterium]|nr:Lrp/AsnC ligand binding domain-containing protein [Caldilineaceae bacterium]MCB9138760.1 Lrp/AsnC ligand binding domain-containing protein [Caldilineaceae bacterium]